jgi:hypothetical protein
MAATGAGTRFILEVFAFAIIRAMELTTILNHCYPHRGFVYDHARFSPDKKSIEVTVRPRKGAQAVCSGCEKPVPGYDRLPERRFEFIPFWGFLVFFLYYRRRVQCRACGVVAEKLPWSDGKHHSTQAHMLWLARWARKLSWKEPPRRSTPPGTGSVTRSSTSFTLAWSIACRSRSTPSAWMKSSTPKATSI